MHLDERLIARCFSDATFARAREYVRRGNVLQVSWEPDEHLVFGLVLGTESRPYQVEVHLSEAEGKLQLESTCTCPVSEKCKHAAALLLEFAKRHPDVDLSAAGKPTYNFVPIEKEAPASQLPGETWYWIHQLQEKLEIPVEEPETTEEVRYVVRVVHPDAPDRYASIDVLTTRPSKTANPHRRHHVSMNSVRANNFARFFRQADLALVRSLYRNLTAADYDVASFKLDGAEGVRHLRTALETGRCRWATLDGPLLHWTESPRRVAIVWEANRNGKQSLRVSIEPSGVLLPMSPPHFVDPQSGEIGPAPAGLSDGAFAMLLKAPDVLPEHSEEFREQLARLLPDRPDLLPASQETKIEADIRPTPILTIEQRSIVYKNYSGWREFPITYDVPVAILRFEYDGIAASGTTDLRKKQADGTLRVIRRHLDEEKYAGDFLEKLGWVAGQYQYGWKLDKEAEKGYVMLPSVPGRGLPDHLQRYLHFIAEDVPELQKHGWRIEMDQVPVAVAPEHVRWEIDAVAEGHDWFDLNLGLIVEGERVDLRPVLIKTLQLVQGRYGALDQVPNEGEVLQEVTGGKVITIPFSRLKPLVRSLIELFGPTHEWGEELRIPAGRAAELAALDEAADTGAFSLKLPDRLRELTERLQAFDHIEKVPPPPGFQGELRPYQSEGLSWLQFLRHYEFGGILADDMGLGKTVQTLAHIMTERAASRLDKPVLIVAPTSTLPNWRREAERFAPELRVLTLQGVGRSKRFAEIANHDLILSTYPLLARDKEAFSKLEFHMAVLDEAQNIKNPSTATAKAACELPARHRICLSGTPVENNLEELWSLMHFLMPGLLGSLTDFRRKFRTPIENLQDKEVRAKLIRRIRPFVLRRTKEQVATELPPKTEVIERVELSGAQRDLYESLRLAMDKRVRDLIATQGIDRSRIEILDALLKLRQVCCDPRLVKLDTAKEVKASAKLDRLMEMLEELHGEGRRVLLFSQFTSMLDLIEARLRDAGREWVRISGDTQDRDTPVRRFQAGEVPLFLISLRAGGTGLNLTAADTVIHYDPWWNPAVERQATDRAHRIGQDKSVFVFKLVAEGTVEEKILELQERKAQLAGALFDENADAAAKLTAEDLSWILE